MNEEILLTRKSPEVQGIIRVNFTETMHCRGGGLQGTTRDDMECAIEEACRAQVAKVAREVHLVIEELQRQSCAFPSLPCPVPRESCWQCGLLQVETALRAAAGMEGGE